MAASPTEPPRTAIVAGGGRAVGLAIALALAGEGMAVAVADVDLDRAAEVVAAVEAAGGSARTVLLDITDYDAVRSGFAAIEADLGPVDVLVINAGMPTERLESPFLESTPDHWKPFIEINLYGSIHCARAVLPGMCERGWGRVVQISSGAAARGLPPSVGYAALGAAKAASEGLVRHLAIEVADRGVTVNALSLGQMTSAADHAEPEVIAMVRANTPVGRPGEPEEAAAAVLWLASEQAGFVTGQVIHLNGGSYQGR